MPLIPRRQSKRIETTPTTRVAPEHHLVGRVAIQCLGARCPAYTAESGLCEGPAYEFLAADGDTATDKQSPSKDDPTTTYSIYGLRCPRSSVHIATTLIHFQEMSTDTIETLTGDFPSHLGNTVVRAAGEFANSIRPILEARN